MLSRRCFCVGFSGLQSWSPRCFVTASNKEILKENVCNRLVKYLRITKTEAEYISLKRPVVNKLSEENLKEIVRTVLDLGFPKEVLVKDPVLFGVLPITLRFRYKVLQECGIQNVTEHHLVSYLTIMKQKTIGELRESRDIPRFLKIENQLAGYMSQWPTSLTTLIDDDVNNYTLYSLRLNIIQRYLELTLDVTKEEFERGVATYPTIKHRPLEIINETLTLLQSVILMPINKIKSNFYLIHAEPENLKQIIYKFRSIGGMDIKEVIRMYPKIAMRNYDTLLEIRKVLLDHSISDEAQTRCFEVYTLAPETINERLNKAKTVPEFAMFLNHPRFLRVIYYNTNAVKRLQRLQRTNKKCVSLNILSGSLAHYETFEKAPGDRLGKSKDLVFCIVQCLGKQYSMADVRNSIKRHPFWVNISLVQVKYVYENLKSVYRFTPEDIYQNCPILLYPWPKIRDVVTQMNSKSDQVFLKSYLNLGSESLDLKKLNKSQTLSLVLYVLERNHYFTGNGVWTEDKNVYIDLNVSPKTKMLTAQ